MKSLAIKLFVLISTILMVSCGEKFLDRQPLDKISVDSYWKTPEDFEKYVVQFYPRFGGFPSEFTGTSDNDSDNGMSLLVNLTLSGRRTSSQGSWRAEWTDIRGINMFFDRFQLLAPEDTTPFAQTLGEAHFFRAWFYYELVNKYGDVPWYSTVVRPESTEQLEKPRDPRTLVVDNILDDLDNAIKFLKLRSEVENTRLNKETALAFQSRVALFEGTWQKYHAGTAFATNGAEPSKYFRKSAEAARELIDGSSYVKGLHSDYYELFGLDNMASIDEVLFWRPSNINEGMGNEAQLYVTNWTAGSGLTWSLVTSYLDRDGNIYDFANLAETHRGNDFLTEVSNDCDPRLSATMWGPGDLRVASDNAVFPGPILNGSPSQTSPSGFQRKKFSNPYSSGAGKNFGGYSETGYIHFRFAEVLLNYAEAVYELEGEVRFNELNQLRQRVGMAPFRINSQEADAHRLDYGYSISDELYEIRRERRVELALEGFRKDDYRRWAAHQLFTGKRPLGYPFKASEFPGFTPPLDANGLIDFHINELPSGYQFDPQRDYLNSIPQDELTLNPNLAPNPGW